MVFMFWAGSSSMVIFWVWDERCGWNNPSVLPTVSKWQDSIGISSISSGFFYFRSFIFYEDLKMDHAQAHAHDVKKEVNTYLFIFACLAFLTIVTVLVSRLH